MGGLVEYLAEPSAVFFLRVPLRTDDETWMKPEPVHYCKLALDTLVPSFASHLGSIDPEQSKPLFKMDVKS